MVYALMAGFPVEYGIFGALLSSIAAAIFSGSHVLNMGPTNSTAVVLLSAFTTAGIFPERYGEFAPSVLFLTGIFLIVGAFFNIASLVRYISKSVIWGYMCAVTAIMIVNQIHNALGFELHFPDGTKRTFLNTLYATVIGLQQTDGASLFLCVLCIAFFYGWGKIFPRGPVIALTVLSIAFASTLLSCMFRISPQTLHAVHIGDWKPSLSGFTREHLHDMAGTAFVLSFVALIDGTAILQTLSARMGKRCNINQMVFGMGWANVLCGIGSGMPSSCSLVRSTANYISGAKTAVAGLFGAFFCFLGILVFGPLFNFVPKSGLSMMIILLGFGLFEKHSLRIILKTDRADACVFVWTFLSSFLFPINVSIILGILISIALFLKKAAAPSFREYAQATVGSPLPADGNDPSEVSVIHAEGHLFFGSAELFRDQIRTVCKRPQLKIIIIQLRGVFHIDATCLLALEELLRYMRANNRRLILTGVNPQALKIFKRSGLYDTVGANFIFPDDERRTGQPMQAAIECARQLTGKDKMVVRLLAQSTAVVDEQALKQSIDSLRKPLLEHSVRVDSK